MIEQFNSIGYVIEKLYRDYGIKYEIPIDDFVEWTADVLRFTGCASQYIETGVELEVIDHRACLPNNFGKIVLITHCGKPLPYGGKPFDTKFHCKKCLNTEFSAPQFTGTILVDNYTVNDSYIITSFKSGHICLDYLGILVDEKGFPKVPDNIYFEKAITAYVIYLTDRITWRIGITPDKVYQESKQDWEWYIQAARSAGNMPSLNQLESLKNTLCRLIPLANSFNQGYKDLGIQEKKYIH